MARRQRYKVSKGADWKPPKKVFNFLDYKQFFVIIFTNAFVASFWFAQTKKVSKKFPLSFF